MTDGLRSHIVVIDAPLLNQYTGLRENVKPVGAQALITQAAIEALDESVLHGFAWLNEVQLDTAPIGPSIEDV